MYAKECKCITMTFALIAAATLAAAMLTLGTASALGAWYCLRHLHRENAHETR